ncbi:MAG TPA: phosphotransferase [Nocardioides sp.]|uniref:phosphotransferase family protein n=1 Tax=Nocardioides sp. TaxID=35761 RepID=UPI002C01B92B|nr:phosphotransferase [Nocardioides sp.]HQR27256.1 phosphotransferase [Nocardioides sp.]
MDLASLRPLPGGWSGETFLAEAAGERSVVRIYARPGHRGEQAQEVDAALLRLVRGLVPVPEVLEVRRADPAAGTPALLVTSFLEGSRGDVLLPSLTERDLRRVGGRLGDLLAVLGGIPMLRPGPFVDADLTIGSFGPADGLPAWVEEHPQAAAAWSADERAGLAEVALRAQALLDTVDRVCLVHSDFNPKNLLFDEDLQVTALLDWEFAHAGHPFTDLGNLLRFDRSPGYVEAVLAAYCSRRGGTPAAALDLARAADLWALVDLAAAPLEGNLVRQLAHDLLRAVAGSRDLHAFPWPP